MSSQSSPDSQTYRAKELSAPGSDSGFNSDNTENMRDNSRVPDVKLSENLLRDIQKNHATHINNLETARTHRQQLQEQQQNIPSSKLDNNSDKIVDKLLDLNKGKCEQIDKLQPKDTSKKGYERFYTQDSDGDTHLHISIAMKHSQVSMWLIDQAPHPSLLDIANDDKLTPLHLAVMASQPLLVRRLILAGANPCLQTRNGDTALHIACTQGDLPCVKALTEPVTPDERSWLVDGRALEPHNFELRNYIGKTCLHIAAQQGHLELVKQLVLCGADAETREGLAGRTALHLAVWDNRDEVARWLPRERPSCIDITTYAGQTAYQIATKTNPSLAEDLLSLGANPELLRDSDSDLDSDSDFDSRSESSCESRSDGSKSSCDDEECKCEGELADHLV